VEVTVTPPPIVDVVAFVTVVVAGRGVTTVEHDEDLTPLLATIPEFVSGLL